MKLLGKKGLDPKSLNTIELMKKLVGESHAESRDFVRQFQDVISRRDASITHEEAVTLANRPKDVPLLEKGKFQPDQTLLQESSLNPVLIKPRKQNQLKLPLMVLDHLKAKKEELEKKNLTSTTPKAINRVLEQYCQSNIEESSMKLGREKSKSKPSMLHKSAPNNGRKKLKQNRYMTQGEHSTPIIIGA